MQNNDFIVFGSLDVSRMVKLYQTNGVTPATGLTIADLDMTWCKDMGSGPSAKVDATVITNGGNKGNHQDNRMIEIDATNMPGFYRADWPDLAFAWEHQSALWDVRRQARQVALCINGAAIQPHSESIHLYRPPGLIYRGWMSGDHPSGRLIGPNAPIIGRPWADSQGALALLSDNGDSQWQARHVVNASSTGIELDRGLSYVEDWAGEIDIIAVPDGYFPGQNPLVLLHCPITTVNSQTEFNLQGTNSQDRPSVDDSCVGMSVLIKAQPTGQDGAEGDEGDSEFNTTGVLRICTAWDATTRVMKIDRAAPWTVANGDFISVLAVPDTTFGGRVTLGKAQEVGPAKTGGYFSVDRMTTSLDESSNTHFVGRTVVWTSGVLLSQARTITGYDGSIQELRYAKTTDAPVVGDTFLIV